MDFTCVGLRFSSDFHLVPFVVVTCGFNGFTGAELCIECFLPRKDLWMRIWTKRDFKWTLVLRINCFSLCLMFRHDCMPSFSSLSILYTHPSSCISFQVLVLARGKLAVESFAWGLSWPLSFLVMLSECRLSMHFEFIIVPWPSFFTIAWRQCVVGFTV